MAQKGAVGRIRAVVHGKRGAVGRIRAQYTSQKKGAVGRLRAVASGELAVIAGANSTTEPWQNVELEASANPSADGITFVWSQDPTDAFQVTLSTVTDNGYLRSFMAPADINSIVLHFTVTATRAGFTTSAASKTVTVNAHGGMLSFVGGVWVPREYV